MNFQDKVQNAKKQRGLFSTACLRNVRELCSWWKSSL